MIRKISFENFYSFHQKQELDFTTSKKKTKDYFLSEDGNTQVSKVIALVGPNASGKTNLARLFGFLAYFFDRTEKIDRGEKDEDLLKGQIHYKTFFNNNAPSKFSLEFELKKKIYFYNLVLQENQVIKEALEVKNFSTNQKKHYVLKGL